MNKLLSTLSLAFILCMFSSLAVQIDIVMRTFERDFPLILMFLRSFELFFPMELLGNLYVVLDQNRQNEIVWRLLISNTSGGRQ